jgi:hypothetical protein
MGWDDHSRSTILGQIAWGAPWYNSLLHAMMLGCPQRSTVVFSADFGALQRLQYARKGAPASVLTDILTAGLVREAAYVWRSNR